MEEVLYRTLRKFKVLNKNVTIQGDRKAVPENYSNAGHTKKSFCSCFTLVLHVLYKDWMSKHLKHLRAEIQHTEILWPQIQKPSFSLCTGAGAVVVVYWSKWLVLWIAFPCSTEGEHSGMWPMSATALSVHTGWDPVLLSSPTKQIPEEKSLILNS